MSAGFTPGPWQIAEDAFQRPHPRHAFIHLGSAANFVSGHIGEANARLIAAAPELLDAAECGLEWAIDAANECTLPKDQAVFDNAMRDVRRIEAALAKARGEQA